MQTRSREALPSTPTIKRKAGGAGLRIGGTDAQARDAGMQAWSTRPPARAERHGGCWARCAGTRAHRAMTNSSRTMRDPSPMYFCTSSPPDTRMKVQSVWCATARASSVLPARRGKQLGA